MSLRDRRTGGTNKLGVLSLFVLVVIGLVAAMYLGRPGGERGRPAAEPEPIFVPGPATFAPGLHVLGALSPSVAYVVETTEGLILVDTGLEDGHTLLLQQFELLGLDIHELKAILVTHGHGDHYLGAVNLQRLTGAKLYAGKGDSQVLRDAGPREAVFSTFAMDHVDIHPTAVDVELVGGEVIVMGDARIEVIATPGHTPGSVCFLLTRNGRTALFSGDTIMTITGDLGTYSTYLSPRYRGDPADYLATLRELEKISAPDLLLPGHPRTDQRMISARITPEKWSSLLSRGILQMEELTARYATDGADFLDGDAKELVAGLHYLGDASQTAVYCFADQSSFILIDASAGPNMLKFLEPRLADIGLDLAGLEAVVLTEADPDALDGLALLVEKTGCRIIAEPTDLDAIRNVVPDASVLPPNEAVKEYPWLPLEPIAVKGFGRTKTAYAIPWQGKRVLMSGRIPLKITAEMVPQLQQMRIDVNAFLQSLGRIQQVEPDLWLPAKPVHGQNANLYGSDWQDILRDLRLSLGLP